MTKRLLMLEIETVGADSIRGRVIGHTSVDFVGWLGLAGAIENQLPVSDVCVGASELPDACPATVI